jgi:hypothetical protein
MEKQLDIQLDLQNRIEDARKPEGVWKQESGPLATNLLYESYKIDPEWRGELSKSESRYILDRKWVRFVVNPEELISEEIKLFADNVVSFSDQYFKIIENAYPELLTNLRRQKPTYTLSYNLRDFEEHDIYTWDSLPAGFASRERHSWIRLNTPRELKSILPHEFAHTVHQHNMNKLDEMIETAYKKLDYDLIESKLGKKIRDNYMFTNKMEFWAVGTELYLHRDNQGIVAWNTKLTYNDIKTNPDLFGDLDEIFVLVYGTGKLDF